jgi:hypothetical protein
VRALESPERGGRRLTPKIYTIEFSYRVVQLIQQLFIYNITKLLAHLKGIISQQTKRYKSSVDAKECWHSWTQCPWYWQALHFFHFKGIISQQTKGYKSLVDTKECWHSWTQCPWYWQPLYFFHLKGIISQQIKRYKSSVDAKECWQSWTLCPWYWQALHFFTLKE